MRLAKPECYMAQRAERVDIIHIKLCRLAYEKHHFGPKMVSEAIS